MDKNVYKLLEENSLKVSKGMIAYYPQFDDSESLDLDEYISKFNDCYAVNNSTICFIVEGGAFVAPYTKGFVSLLEDAGLKEASFYVPFSNWDYPYEKKDEWEKLRKNASKKTLQEFTDECLRISKEKGLKEISPKALANCIIIPHDGEEIVHPVHQYRDMLFPIITPSVAVSTIEENIGIYCTNNGVVVFVYCDGNTYLTKGYKITYLLDKAGFKKTDLFVPLSNGEKLTNPVMQMRWLNVSKNNF